MPIGVGTAIYLEEYANRERWYNRLLEVNIQNLAAVPSIVYGILGLAFLVRGLGLGRVLLAGALILTLLVLPTVIVASREAIRAVPDSIRQGAYALGATQWQVVWRQVLPAAIPGIATGSILALARAIGETAPLLLVGALTYVAFEPDAPRLLHGAARPDLPVDRRGRRRSSGCSPRPAIIVLLVILLTMNAFAIWLRNRYQKKMVMADMESATAHLRRFAAWTRSSSPSGRAMPPSARREVVFDVWDLTVALRGRSGAARASRSRSTRTS